ncbi:hypothetical protein [Paenibacillus illinoisensis]|uniref:hypothetical protein n=1 Tax=Paenibacillus illinoisensis TaxID=59845 RepID=UPI00203FFA16|nr:hypothetical protein [Paenibacillus illinoisensis]MCM3203999.1 hypothetical protein [Paenibacillus illinoisensis]
MIDYLKNKGIKAFYEISTIAEHPNLLFSNDREQYFSEAQFNLYTIQKLNKLIKKHKLSLNELQQIFGYIETSWTNYLRKYYRGKSFIFYLWGDEQIPEIRFSVVSYYEGVELPFRCSLNKVHDMSEVLSLYVNKTQFDGVTIIELDEVDETDNSPSSGSDYGYTLTVYSRKIIC